MSKNIVIQEGGIGKQLTADKLKTNLVSGGTCLWVPEDGTVLGTKSITENGTYKATDDGYYGYSEVTVSGIGTATGTGSDGEDHSYTEDGTGGVTDTILPYSISVVTPPTVTTYADGATIDFSGMVVKAYLKSGGVWSDASHPNGIIPVSELTLPVTTADKDESRSDEWSDGHGVNATLVSYTEHWDLSWDKKTEVQKWVSQALGTYGGLPAMMGGSGPTQFFITIYNDKMYVWGSTADRGINTYDYDPSREWGRWRLVKGRSLSTGTGALKSFSAIEEFTQVAASTVEPTGTGELQPVAAYQTIPVQWNRPRDYKTLESSFDITVT